jgi:hypothetical protein
MRRIALFMCMAVFGVALAACGSEWEPNSDPFVAPPGQPTLPPDVKSTASALQSVVSSLTLSTSGQQHGLDLNGDGVVDNQIGRFLGQVKQLVGLDLQADLDTHLAKGKALLLYDVIADSLVDANQVQIRAYVGSDLDSDPSDNFSGIESFRASSPTATSPVLPAAISAGLLASTKPGVGMISLPFVSDTTVLPLQRTRLQAKVGHDGMRQGILAGAISVADAKTRLAPVLSNELNRLYRRPGQDPLLVNVIRATLDTNKDGQLTAPEFVASDFFKLFLNTADVDTDNDGAADAISFGIAFKSVPCSINVLQ